MYGHKLSSGMGRTTRRFGLGDDACTDSNGVAYDCSVGVAAQIQPVALPPLSSANAATSTLPSWALPAAGIAVVLLLLMGGRR